jgi:hypothetical protein
MALPDEGATRAPTVDDWGRDPQIRAMRSIFALMETLQSRLLEKIGISPFDERLGRWRRFALRMFELKWADLSRRGGRFSEEDLADTYLDCLIKILTNEGVTISKEVLSSVRSLNQA